jgi:hypothetical protein
VAAVRDDQRAHRGVLYLLRVQVRVESGGDVYPLIRQWVEDLWAARRGAGNGTGSVVLQDSRDSQLVLSSTLPEEALEALRDVDWAAVEGDYLIWSEKKRQWLDQMKHPSAF